MRSKSLAGIRPGIDACPGLGGSELFRPEENNCRCCDGIDRYLLGLACPNQGAPPLDGGLDSIFTLFGGDSPRSLPLLEQEASRALSLLEEDSSWSLSLFKIRKNDKVLC